jgi:predicted site-specific integrase-resolvase
MADFTAIITSFCARLYGQRRGKHKKQALVGELNATD